MGRGKGAGLKFTMEPSCRHLMMRSDGAGGYMYVLRVIYSFKMSF